MNDRLKLQQNFRMMKILALASAMVLTACDKEDPQQFINEGRALFEKGDMDSARVQFKNALQINPKLAEAYYGLALLDEKEPDLLAMRQNLQEVITLNPNHSEAQVKLGFLLINDISKAKEKASIALKLEPENNDAILLDGRIRYEEGKFDEALKQAERVLSKEPGNAKAAWLKAYTLLTQKQYDEALDALNQGLEKDPANIGLNALKVRLHEEQKKYTEVIQDFDYLVKMHPDDKKIRIDRINSLIRFGKPDQVEAAMLETIEKYPEDTGLKNQLVNFIAARGDLARTEAKLKEFISASPHELKLKTRLAELYLAKKQIPEAQAVLNEVVLADPNGKEGFAAKVSLAELALAQNDKATAEMLVEDVIKADAGNSGALLLRANMRMTKHDIDGGISDLRIVLRDQPNSDQAMVLMGEAYAIKGEAEVAESHWRKALEANPGNLSALAPLTTMLFKRGDSARVEELLNKSLKASPDNPAMLELLVQARAAQKNWTGAEAAVNELKKQPQAILAAKMLEGMLAASQGRHHDAIQTYKDILVQKPNAAEALVAMARSYEAAGQRGEYFTFLKTFIQQNPTNIGAYNALGMAYAAEKKWADASKTLRDAFKQDPNAIATYKLLAGVLAQQGKATDMVELYRNGLAASPDNPELMLELAKYYESAKDHKAAIAAYTNLLDKHSNNDEAANNLAFLLVEFDTAPDKLERAIALAERFKDSRNPYFLDTYGWVLFKAGKPDHSVEVLKKVVAIVPDNAEFHYHLGEAYHAAGDKNAAKLELEKSLSLAQQREFSGFDRAKELLKQLDKPVAPA